MALTHLRDELSSAGWPSALPVPSLVAMLRIAAALGLAAFALCALALPDRLPQLLGVFLVLSLGVGAVLFPWVTLGVAIFSLVISFEWFRGPNLWVAEHLGDFEVTSFHKLVILILLGPAILRGGLRPRFNPAVAGVVLMLALTFAVSTRYPGLTALQSVKTLFGLGVPLLFFSINFARKPLDRYLLLIALMPIFSLVLGFAAELLGVYSADLIRWEAARIDYMGAMRLMGSNIPAGLAFLSFTSIVVSLFQALTRGKRKYLVLAGISMVILILTGTRTPTACALVLGAFATLLLSGRSVKLSDRFVISILGALVVSLVLLFYWPSLELRFGFGASATDINVSGRDQIWQAALATINVDPIFGRGLGTGAIFLLDNASSTLVHARAAHNEYLRLLLDGGVVGLVIYIAGFAALMARECRQLTRDQKRYFGLFFFVFALYSLTDNTISSLMTVVMFFSLAVMFTLGRYEARERAARA